MLKLSEMFDNLPNFCYKGNVKFEDIVYDVDVDNWIYIESNIAHMSPVFFIKNLIELYEMKKCLKNSVHSSNLNQSKSTGYQRNLTPSNS